MGCEMCVMGWVSGVFTVTWNLSGTATMTPLEVATE